MLRLSSLVVPCSSVHRRAPSTQIRMKAIGYERRYPTNRCCLLCSMMLHHSYLASIISLFAMLNKKHNYYAWNFIHGRNMLNPDQLPVIIQKEEHDLLSMSIKKMSTRDRILRIFPLSVGVVSGMTAPWGCREKTFVLPTVTNKESEKENTHKNFNLQTFYKKRL